jgi:DNA-binding NarL/FixJ family response regulator
VIRVLIADDQALVRGGFRMILESADDIDVLGEAATGKEVLELARRAPVDVVLMDIRMPELDGIEATRRLLGAAGPAPRVLILTTFDLDEYVYDALRAGASGFLLKDIDPPELVRAVRAVHAGEALLAPAITRRLVEHFTRRPAPGSRTPPELAELTARELDVLRELARGLSNAEIATALFLSPATVKTHVARILMKLGLRDRVQAVVFAYQTGLVA